MRRLLFIRLFCAGVLLLPAAGLLAGGSAGSLPPVDLSRVSEEALVPGLIRIRFAPDKGEQLEKMGLAKSADGLVVTGLKAFDALSHRYMLVDARPMLDKVYEASPTSHQYRERHRASGLHLWYEFRTLAKSDELVSVVKEFQQLPEVAVAEPVYRIKLIEPVEEVAAALQDMQSLQNHPIQKAITWTPNDPQYPSNQWHLNNTGQNIGGVVGTSGADISMPDAWGIQKGDSDVIVAVLDTGVQHNHPDLSGNIWSGIGYNFVDDNMNIHPEDHGTHVAGSIAAVTNNATGVAGIAGGSGSGNGVRIMICQIIKGPNSSDALPAFIYAADNGAAIAQNSWGYQEAGVYNQSDLDGIDYFNAYGGGGVLNGGISIFAAGNDNSQDPSYPAYYPGAFSVAATTNQDLRASYSNYGSWIDVSAPGSWIYSTKTGSSYGFMSGTSAACPQVSGVAALIVSEAPGQLTAAELAGIIKSTTDNIDGLNPSFAGLLGTGRVNAYQALLDLSGAPPPLANPAWLSAEPYGSNRIQISWQKNDSTNPVMLAWSENNIFGNPADGTAYSAGQSIPGGGIVLYRGSNDSYLHEGLQTNTTYYYKAWSYDDSNAYSSGIQASATSIQSFVINATNGPGGSITPSGTIILTQGQDQLFAIQPDEGFHIAGVTVDGSSVGAVSSYLFTNISRDHSIHAQFASNTYTIQAGAGQGGSIIPSGNVVVEAGQDQSFQIVANPGYVIRNVYVNGSALGPLDSYEFLQVNANQTILAEFDPLLFTIEASASAGGTISPSGRLVYQYGAEAMFVFTPDYGYRIDDVLIDGYSVGSPQNYLFSHIDADHSIHVIFAVQSYTITASATVGGSIEPNGINTVWHGDDLEFIIAANTGYLISNVYVNGWAVGPVERYMFDNVRRDNTIHAVFTPKLYTVNASAGPNGSISPSGQIKVAHGQDQAFTIEPAEGYHISRVMVDDEEIGAPESYTFFEVVSDHSIHADFEINTYTVTATTDDGGTISPTGQISVTHGQGIDFGIFPDPGYEVKDVVINGWRIGTADHYSFENIRSGQSIHVEFKTLLYTLTATSGAGGTISPTGQVAVTVHDGQSFQITPDTGFHISDVLVDEMSVGAVTSYTFANVLSDQSIHALFDVNTYTITATTGEGGTISPTGVHPVRHGDGLTFAITPDDGYYIKDVWVDGQAMGGITSYTFSDVEAAHHIHALFESKTYIITATTTEGGAILPEGAVVVSHGNDQVFSIMPEESYHVMDVLVDGESVGAVLEYTFVSVASSHSIHAVFEADPEPLYEVVFSVDMQFAEGFVPSHDNLYLTGSMINWQVPGIWLNGKSGQAIASPMMFYAALELEAGTYEYLYYLNDFPDGAEWTDKGYRTLTVPDTLSTYDIFGYRTDPTHVTEQENENRILVYPNPAGDLVNIKSTELLNTILLVDLFGRSLKMVSPGSSYFTLDLTGLAPGVYILRMTTEGRRMRSVRLVKNLTGF